MATSNCSSEVFFKNEILIMKISQYYFTTIIAYIALLNVVFI